MRRSRARRYTVAAILMAAGIAGAASAQSTCAELAGRNLQGALVLEAESTSGSTEVATAFVGRVVLERTVCRVGGRIRPSADSDIRFEVWLPEAAAWNGRYQGVGGGGNAGTIPLPWMKHAVDGGYAVSGQDNGHVGSMDDSSYAVGHPEKVIDFGWRSLHAVAVASKSIIEAYYGRAPDLSLWNGCSTGGRQGLALAQRFPDDYDGIAVGAPANYWPELNTMHAEFGRFLLENPESWVSPQKLSFLQDAVHEACGAVEGILDDPANCSIDLSTLRCPEEPADDCLTQAEIAGVEKRFAGLVDDRGKVLYPGLSHGLESSLGPNWMGIDPLEPFYSSLTWRFAEGFFADYVHGRDDWSVRELDWKADLKLARSGVIGISVAAEDSDLSAFAQSGGKVLHWHGWHDMGIPAKNSIRYYEDVVAKMGRDAVEPFYRLFLGTGVEHCGGGPGPGAIGGAFGLPAPQRDAKHDVIEALVQWLEDGVAPDELVATQYGEDGTVAAQRPWCAYPRVGRWDGKSDRSKVESYRCSD